MRAIPPVENTRFTPLEPGTYPAVCCGFIDLGDQYNKKYGRWSRQFALLWDIKDQDGTPRIVDKIYPFESSRFRKDLESWRGRSQTPEEAAVPFDIPSALLGEPCMLEITTYTNGIYVNANVENILPYPKYVSPPEEHFPVAMFDLDQDDLSRIDALPKKLASIIRKSRQYEIRTGAQTHAPASSAPPPSADADDDEVPF